MNLQEDQRTLHRRARECTILKNREIRQVITPGKSFVIQYFVVYTLPNGKNISKIGFCTGRAAGRAVKRNRIRRRTKELFRLAARELPAGYSVVIIARPAVYAGKFQLLLRALEQLLVRAGLLVPDRNTEAKTNGKDAPMERRQPQNARTNKDKPSSEKNK